MLRTVFQSNIIPDYVMAATTSPYEAQPLPSNDEPPPAYPDEAPPPPAAFGQVPPNAVQLVPGRVKHVAGEVYQETHTTSPRDNAPGGGEHVEPKPIIVVLPPQNPYPAYPGAVNRYQNFEYSSNKPEDLLSCKMRDQRVNAFGSGDSCVCFCHLQLASYLLSVLFIIGNMFAVERYLVSGGYWIYRGFEEYDLCLGVYYTICVVINIVCVIGITKCRSQWIQPQPYLLLSYIGVLIVDTVLNTIANEIYLSQVLVTIVIVFCQVWFAWIFHRVYLWAYYFENGGTYVADMCQPPAKSQIRQQAHPAPAQEIEMPVIPQDGH
eukprot:323319_1